MHATHIQHRKLQTVALTLNSECRVMPAVSGYLAFCFRLFGLHQCNEPSPSDKRTRIQLWTAMPNTRTHAHLHTHTHTHTHTYTHARAHKHGQHARTHRQRTYLVVTDTSLLEFHNPTKEQLGSDGWKGREAERPVGAPTRRLDRTA